MRVLATLTLVVAVLAAGCSDDATESADRPTTTAAPTSTAAPATTAAVATTAAPSTTAGGNDGPGPRASAGCAGEPVAPGTTRATIVTADGRERTYTLTVPTAHGDSPSPLVLDFHGFTSNGGQQAVLSGFAPLGEAEGFVVVHPLGTVDPLLGQTYWNITTDDDPATVDDVAFVAELLDRLEAELCLDTTRIFSTGMSNGGFFSARLACDLADRIAAIGTVTGISHYDDCAPGRPVPVVHFHGTDDPIVPFDGGSSTLLDLVDLAVGLDNATLANFFVPIPDEVAEWAEANGCGREPAVTVISTEVELHEYPDCTAEVDFYVFDGGHTWPGSTVMQGLELLLGATTMDIDATALIWEWFERHPLT